MDMCIACEDLQKEINAAQKEMNECPCDSPCRELKAIPERGLLTIEKDVPFVKKETKIGILRQMEVGDSVLIPNCTRNSAKHWQAELQKKLGWKMATLKVDGGVRIWRMA